MSHLQHPEYRADIDGLRAFAVLSVVIFHAFPDVLRGGFVGVDVFFVISGYLISTILFKSLESGSFGFYEFYARRVRRIFPALLAVLGVVFCLGWLILFSSEFAQLGKHLLAGSLFASNIVFWREAGYFDGASESKPLLHLWSLGIEEQFYLVWPLLLWAFWRLRFNYWWCLVSIAVASFSVNIWLSYGNAVAAFYSPFSRFWELSSGAALAYQTLGKKTVCVDNGGTSGDKRLAAMVSKHELLFISGVVLLVVSVLLVDRDRRFPGWWALMPVAGSVLAIYAGKQSRMAYLLFSNRLMVWLGLISFPLYLWHWPLLSFSLIYEAGGLSVTERLGLVLLSVLCAWITYKFVEYPVRHASLDKWVGMLVMPMLAIACIGGVVLYEKGFEFRHAERERFYGVFENSVPGWHYSTVNHLFERYRVDCDFYDLEAYRKGFSTNIPRPSISDSCYKRDPKAESLLFIWGDSHAQQLNYGLSESLGERWQLLQVASSGCTPSLFGPEKSDKAYCERSNEFALEAIRDTKPDVVLVAQNSQFVVDRMIAIRNHLTSLGVKKVIFVGPVPHWMNELPKIIARQLWFDTPERTWVGVDRKYIDYNNKLKEVLLTNGLSYVDAMDIFCNQKGCLTRLGPDREKDIVSHDYGHLLPVASKYLATKGIIPLLTEP